MSYVIETPSQSEDELDSIPEVIQSSLNVSDDEFPNISSIAKIDSDDTIDCQDSSMIVTTVKKKNKALIIESDESENETEMSVVKIDTKRKVITTQIGSNDEHRMNYRESIHVIDSRSPSPQEHHHDILEISSEDEQNIATVLDNIPTPNLNQDNFEVSDMEYKKQQEKISKLVETEVHCQRSRSIVKLTSLPDQGAALIQKCEHLRNEIEKEREILKKMVIIKGTEIRNSVVQWRNVADQIDNVQPKTFGKKAVQTINIQKALTMDKLEQLHESLKTCPDSSLFADQPKGIKVELMPHQKHALAWLVWRENQKPSGGILADDMGLGKTLTMISLILKSLQEHKEDSDDEETQENRKHHKYPGGTLVVCPASLVHQWSAEIESRLKRGLMSVDIFHGINRETKAKRLAKFNVVITTYSLILNDHSKNGPLFNIKWRRLILDEAHQIRNFKSSTSSAVCELSAKSRWSLTGTPIHNKELDLYAQLKFLRCSPFDDLRVWRNWMANKTTGGQDRLNMVTSSLILRRTKQQLTEKNMLACLPTKTLKLIDVTLDRNETNLYQKVLVFSRTLFAQFLHKRAEKNSDISTKFTGEANSEYFKIHKQLVKLNRFKEVKQHHILVLLMRLRQICCHPSLIINMLDENDNSQDSEGEECEEINILDQLSKLKINDDDEQQQEEGVSFADAVKNILNPSNPMFKKSHLSSKISYIMNILNEILPSGDKIIVVSQWTMLLDLIGLQLEIKKIPFFKLDGRVPVVKRMDIVHNINNVSDSKIQILLLSLTAGGVGLNLIGANHLILTDLHWNPQLEMQAQDRIFRVGQVKPIKIYKLMVVDTIEERIKSLQDLKLNIASEILSGAAIQSKKLSLNDLRMLFSM